MKRKVTKKEIIELKLIIKRIEKEGWISYNAKSNILSIGTDKWHSPEVNVYHIGRM